VPRFYIENFGCRAAQADGLAIEHQLRGRGLARAESAQHAELVVLNSCTVTASADSATRAAIRRVHLANPGCQIVVTGCYAQRAPAEIAALPGVSQVIGNSHKHLLADLALPSRPAAFVPLASLTASDRPRIVVSDIFAHTELAGAAVFPGQEHTRPILKVQDGCDNRCSFCVIPSVRGRSRSLALEQVLREVNVLVASGYRELVISGINLGRWGRDFAASGKARWLIEGQRSAAAGGADRTGSFSAAEAAIEPLGAARTQAWAKENGAARSAPHHRGLEGLMVEILHQTAIEKLRISSVEPMDWSDALIGLMARSPRIAKHAHAPMQSGSDRVLRLMHRKYRPWHYREKITKIRAAMPAAAIGADVMVGFPGESESDFEETRSFIATLPLTYLHVFTYSSRPGTASAQLPDPVPVHIARQRNRVLRDLSAEKKLAFMKSFVGDRMEALTLNRCDGEYTEALTDNYLKLRLPGRYEPNQRVIAEVGSANQEFLLGVSASLQRVPLRKVG
jgi:threonylcarbamoyladenosine tRNA methylthiotransferase MtaB